MAENAVNQKALSASGHALVRWFNLWFACSAMGV